MKVIGIVCSPRLEGNTQILVEEALQAASEMGAQVELYLAAGKSITPCDACDFCWESRECCIDDDMRELYAKLLEADGIIFGSPVYFSSVSAQAKAIIDRTYAFRRERSLRDKVGGAIVVARKRGLSGAMATITAFFNAHYVIIAGASSALGRTRGEVRQDRRGMRDARRIGTMMVTLIRGKELAASSQ